MTGPVTLDAYAHITGLSGSPTVFTAAANGVTTPGTIAVATAGAGAGSSVTIPATSVPNDTRGTFTITGAGAPAAGLVARVNFAQSYSSIPIVAVNLALTATTGVLCTAVNVTTSGFDIYAGAAITVGANTCSYIVMGGGSL